MDKNFTIPRLKNKSSSKKECFQRIIWNENIWGIEKRFEKKKFNLVNYLSETQICSQCKKTIYDRNENYNPGNAVFIQNILQNIQNVTNI